MKSGDRADNAGAGQGLTRRTLLTSTMALPLIGGAVAGCGKQNPQVVQTSLPLDARPILVLANPRAPHPPGTPSYDQALRDSLSTSTPSSALGEIDVVATPDHQAQAEQVRHAVRRGIGTLVVQAVDPSRIGEDLDAAGEAGTQVITWDTVVRKTVAKGHDVIAHVGWDEFASGENELQGFVDREYANTMLYAEFVSLGPLDINAQARLNGNIFCVHRLEPDQILNVKSGQINYASTQASADARPKVTRRLTTTYRATYPRHELNAVGVPGDSWADVVWGVADSLRRPRPLLLSSGASEQGIRAVVQGGFFSTQYRDPSVLASLLVQFLAQRRRGEPLEFSHLQAGRNQVSRVPSAFAQPVLVTKANARQALSANAVLGPLARA